MWEPACLFILVCQTATMGEQTSFGVHLFHGSRLIANLVTGAALPDDSYVIDGVSYTVVSVEGPRLESDGGQGWDVQVEPQD
jgi:hypothetical protein